MGRTTIQVSDELADELYERKGRGESYEDVIWRALEAEAAGTDAGDASTPTPDDAHAGREAPSAPSGETDDRTPTDAPRRDDAPTAGRGGDASGAATDDAADADETDDLAAVIDAVSVPGRGAKADERREAVRAAVEYIREHGRATAGEVKDEVYPDHPARYVDGSNPPRSWWKNCIYPALREIAERDDRLGKADTTGVWTWRGEDA